MHGHSLLKASRLVGSQKKLAKGIGVSPQCLNTWINHGVDIPYEYALAIEHKTNGVVTAEELSPEKALITNSLYSQPNRQKLCRVIEVPIEKIQIEHPYKRTSD